MSYHDRRFDRNESSKSNRNESPRKRRESPERYNHSSNYSRKFQQNNGRQHYGNRDWVTNTFPNRSINYDPNRYRYVRNEQSCTKDGYNENSKFQHSDHTTQESSTSKRHRPYDVHPGKYTESSSITSLQRSKTEPWQRVQSSACEFQRINTALQEVQSGESMTLIDRLIADEAIRMLSEASSGNKTTSLNEPCEPMEIVAASTRNELTETTTTPVNSTITEQAAVRAADSMLLQKSAEQVTKKLINQLSTMNKYDLKQIIHNPAGKYETALNKHAQNKLRAEVRKQLNNIRVNEMISPCGNGVEPDEAIDAEKIHPELLEQIGKTLDLNFFTLPTIDLNELNQREVPSEEVVDKYSLSLKDIGSVNSNENRLSKGNSPIHSSQEQVIASSTVSINSTAKRLAENNSIHDICTMNIEPEPASDQSLESLKHNSADRGSYLRISSVQELNRRHNSFDDANATYNTNTLHAPKTTPSPAVGEKDVVCQIQPALAVTKPISPMKNIWKAPFLQANSIQQSIPNSHTDQQLVATLNLNNATATPFQSVVHTGPTNQTSTDGSIIKLGEHNNTIEYIQNVQERNKGKRTLEKSTSLKSPVLWQWHDFEAKVSEMYSTKNAQPPDNSCPSKSPAAKRMALNKPRNVNQHTKQKTTAPSSETESLSHPSYQACMVGSNEKNDLRTKSPVPVAISSLRSAQDLDHQKQQASMLRIDKSLTKSKANKPSNHTKKVTNSARNKKKKAKNTRQNKKPNWFVAANKTEACLEPSINNVKLFESIITPANWPRSNGSMPQLEPHADGTGHVTCSSLTPTGDTIDDRILAKSFAENSNPHHHFEKTKESNQTSKAQEENSIPYIKVLDAARLQVRSFAASDRIHADGDNISKDSTKSSSVHLKQHSISLETSSTRRLSQEMLNVERNATLLEQRDDVQTEKHVKNLLDTNYDEFETMETTVKNGTDAEITNSNNGVADNEEQRTNNSDTCAPSSPGYILPDNIEGTHLSPSVIDNASANDQPLGNEIEDKYSPDLNGSENAGTYPQLTVQDSPIDSVLPSTRLQHLLTIIEQMESIEAQTMQLFNRKMQIDATIMRLNSERMEIDQQLVQLQNDRGKQLSTLRLNMLDTSSIGTSRSVSQTHANDVANLAPGPLNLGILNPSEINQNQQFNAGVQQERTIRRITPISGKSVLMQIFQRMRASSERSTDDNPVIDHA